MAEQGAPEAQKGRVAVASSDGVHVDLHFGKAHQFYLYDISGAEPRRLGVRIAERACIGKGHDAGRLADTIERLSDCQYLVVAKIGAGAANLAEGAGLAPYELPGTIEESLEKLSQYIQLNELLEKGF